MKVDLGGKHYDIGEPNQASARILEILMHDTSVPLEAMAAIELARAGLNRIHRDLGLGAGKSPETVEDEIEQGWKAAREVADHLYRSVRD